jgi:plastocyanin
MNPLILNKKKVFLFSSLIIIALILGCNKSSNPTSPPSTGGSSSNTLSISMKNIAYLPKVDTVSSGSKVTWTNNDSMAHTVTSGSPGNQTGLFDSGTINAGATFTHTFSSAGTYPYFCTIHGSAMVGAIVVK